MPPSDPPATAASRVMPSSASSARSTRTMSATVMTGKSDPYGLPVAGFDRGRPGRAAAAAEQVGADDEEAIGVEGLAGADHAVPPAEPAALAGVALVGAEPVAGALRPSAPGEKPAACASPLSAWQTRITLSRAGDSVP